MLGRIKPRLEPSPSLGCSARARPYIYKKKIPNQRQQPAALERKKTKKRKKIELAQLGKARAWAWAWARARAHKKTQIILPEPSSSLEFWLVSPLSSARLGSSTLLDIAFLTFCLSHCHWIEDFLDFSKGLSIDLFPFVLTFFFNNSIERPTRLLTLVRTFSNTSKKLFL